MKTKVIGIVSVKGGVGKTTVTSNLGAVLADEFGKKVCLIDANFRAPNLGMHLGVVESDHTIHHVLKGEKHIFSTVHNYEDSFHFIPASMTLKRVPWEGFKNKIRSLKGKYDYIIIDASPSRQIQATIDASNALIVVATPDYPTISTTLKTVKLIEKSKKPIIGVVLNRVYKKKYQLQPEEIEETLGYTVLGNLKEDKKMGKALLKMQPFAYAYPWRKLSRQYRRLASIILQK